MTIKDTIAGLRGAGARVQSVDMRGLRKLGPTSWLVGATVAVLLFELVRGNAGCVEVHPGQVAVVYNNTGVPIFGDAQKTVVDQGVVSFFPGIHTVEVLERKPQALVMSGSPDQASPAPTGPDDDPADHVRALTVRANDGSNFYFDGLEVHYQLLASEAVKVITTSGPGSGYKQMVMKTHVREILRDEFGAYSFLDIANPTSYGAATAEAKRRLNDRLAAYGIEVTQIITPKPKFDPRVEKAIEDRQNAEQEVSVQEEKRNKLEQEKGLKLQAVEQEKNQEYQGLITDLESQKKAGENKLLSVRREADKYFIDNEASGTAYLDEKLTRAKANEVAYRKEAEGMAARISSVGSQGPDVLNSVIAEHVFPQLKKVSASPYTRPSSSIDIRNLPAAGVSP